MNDMTPRIPKRPLLWPDSILELADLLAGSAEPVFAVGGAVRDAYFGAPLHDLDLVIPNGAAILARQLANALKGDVYVMDADRDVARVLADTPHGRLSIDVAAFRAPDLLRDLTERDFTINAIAVDLREPDMLIDPLNGETDLVGRLIRRCSEHAISSDPIRALRAVRQSVQLKAHIEKATMLDVRANAARLYETSPERVRDEFIKMLAGPQPQTALRVAHKLGLLSPILPDLASLRDEAFEHTLRVVEHIANILIVVSPQRNDNTAAAFGLGAMVVALDQYRRKIQDHIAYEWPNERPHRAVLYLSALLTNVIPNVQNVNGYTESVAEHLRLSNPERARLTAILGADGQIVTSDALLDVLAQHRYWHNLGAAGIDVIILALARYMADAGVTLERDAWVKTLERARILLEAYYGRHAEVVAPPAVIDGNLLITALKLKPGPIIRELLDYVREAQVTGVVTDESSALTAASEYIAANRHT